MSRGRQRSEAVAGPEDAFADLVRRQISGGERYVCPAPGHPTAGSPGCR